MIDSTVTETNPRTFNSELVVNATTALNEIEIAFKSPKASSLQTIAESLVSQIEMEFAKHKAAGLDYVPTSFMLLIVPVASDSPGPTPNHLPTNP